jgi:hypothetical protein
MVRISRLARLAAVTCTVTLGLVISVSAPAQAVDGWQRATNVAEDTYANDHAKVCSGDPTYGPGFGCFQPYGEWFWLKDHNPNNQPVGIQWWYTAPGGGGARAGVIYWDGTTTAGWTNLNKSFDELGDLSFRMCEVNIPAKTVVTSTCADLETSDT